MRKGRELLGLPVISLDTGTRVGQVMDLIFDASSRRISGVVLEPEGWFRDVRVIPLEQLAGVGQDALTIRGKKAIQTAGSGSRLGGRAQSSLAKTRGKQVLTTGGIEIGTVEDMVVEFPGGHVEGLELSGGLVNDVVKGRAVLAETEVITFGKDALIVPDTMAGFWQQVGEV